MCNQVDGEAIQLKHQLRTTKNAFAVSLGFDSVAATGMDSLSLDAWSWSIIYVGAFLLESAMLSIPPCVFASTRHQTRPLALRERVV
jgi:hypothetical protein